MLVRVRGDLYPIEATLSINGVAVNLAETTVRFSYVKEGGKIGKSIVGTVIDAPLGKVRFQPIVGDFSEVGAFMFDIEASVAGIPTTYRIDRLKIIDDVSK